MSAGIRACRQVCGQQDLTGPGIRNAHRAWAPPLPTVPADEAPEGGIRDRAAPVGQQFLDPREEKSVASKPGMDLVGPGLQGSFGGDRHLAGAAQVQWRQAGKLFLVHILYSRFAW
jgi:hypothetical protein